jgi:hypothetical protein
LVHRLLNPVRELDPGPADSARQSLPDGRQAGQDFLQGEPYQNDGVVIIAAAKPDNAGLDLKAADEDAANIPVLPLDVCSGRVLGREGGAGADLKDAKGGP